MKRSEAKRPEAKVAATKPANTPYLAVQSPLKSMPMAARLQLVGACLFVAISLSVTYFYLIGPLILGRNGNGTNLWVFTAMSKSNYHLSQLYDVWRPRVGGLFLAGKMVDVKADQALAAGKTQLDGDELQRMFGAYHAIWLFGFFLVIIFTTKDPLFYLFAIFAGLHYMLTPRADFYSYPWDIPSMTFFTLECLLFLKGRYWTMAVVLLVGTCFKETAAVPGILFLFIDQPWKHRLKYFAVVFFGALAIKLTITYFVEGHIQLFTQQVVHDEKTKESVFRYNIRVNLLGTQLNHFFFVNAGTFLIMLLLPTPTRQSKAIKCAIAVFFLGQMISGALNEFRVMLEILPISMIQLREYFDRLTLRKPAATSPA